MGKFSGVLLVTDFDDTLYDTTGHVPQANLDAIAYFKEQGGYFTVATGRAYRTFAPYAHMAPVNAPVILSNGSAIYDFDQKRMLVQTFLPEQAPATLSALCDAFPTAAMETYYGEEIYAFRPNEITDFHMKKVGCSYTECPIAEMPTPWTKAILHEEHDLLRQMQASLLDHHGEDYEAIFSNLRYLEITKKHSHKGGMVLKLAQMLNIPRDHIYCVGDNQNDIPMLSISKIPFAPSNCAPAVREFGPQILCHCDQGVIADIVTILDQRYGQ